MGKPRLTEEDFRRAANRLRCEVAAIKAVAKVESLGVGFYADGFPVILFERHIFRRETKGKYSKSYPNLSGPPGNYGPAGKNQRVKFSQAFELNPEAAMKSCSWGRFQIMGFNHKACGYATVGSFVDAMKEDEGKQLDAFVAFVESQNLGKHLRSKDFTAFARGYNGAGYAKNKYDTKMLAAYSKFQREPSTSSAVASLPSEQAGASLNPQETAGAPPIIPLVPSPQPVIEVDQIAAEPAKEDVLTKIGNKAVALWTAAGATLTAIFSWAASTPITLILVFVGAAALIGAIWMIVNALRQNAKEKRDKELTLDRERRAFELQKLTLESAMRPDLNAVRISQPPPTEISNSEASEAQQ